MIVESNHGIAMVLILIRFRIGLKKNGEQVLYQLETSMQGVTSISS